MCHYVEIVLRYQIDLLLLLLLFVCYVSLGISLFYYPLMETFKKINTISIYKSNSVKNKGWLVVLFYGVSTLFRWFNDE